MRRLLTARAPALPLAVCRIGVAIGAVGRGLKTGRDLSLLHGGSRAVPAPVFGWSPDLTAAPVIILLTAVWMAASAGLLVGYRARLSAGVLFALIVLLYLDDQNLWANHMYFLALVCLLLALSDSDAALSVRPRGERGAGDGATIAAWPVLLLKIQLSIVYFFSAAWKLNPVFLSGASLAEHHTMAVTLMPPAILAGLAGVTVASEFALSSALWVKRLRWWAIALGVALHALAPVILGFYAGLIIFSVLVVSLYPLFLDDQDLDRALRAGRRFAG